MSLAEAKIEKIHSSVPIPSHQDSQQSNICDFVAHWSSRYELKIKEIPLFQPGFSETWSFEQKVHFAKVFYHIRGHFHDFLWYMGNKAPDKLSKDIILHNMAEEFGGSGQSHEALYLKFANSLSANLSAEIAEQKNYLPFAREFNSGHLLWLQAHDWETNLCAFSAYEKLDNVDYNYLYQLAKNLGAENDALLFFLVHKHVKHFETVLEPLQKTWASDPKKVVIAFDFIASHQLKMWNNLSWEVSRHGLASSRKKMANQSFQ